MAKLLFKEGNFRILSDDVGKLSAMEMNQLIKDAGTTCYQTRETSKKSPEEFIKMLRARTHYSVLEHSWFCFLVSGDEKLMEKLGYQLYKANNLFCITRRDHRRFIVSGNSQIFNAALQKGLNKNNNVILENIYEYLHNKNSSLFPYEFNTNPFVVTIYPNPEFITDYEILVHRAMTVEFNNHCRGFTHEDVRHRNGDEAITSYSQESTRYVDYSKGEINLDCFKIKFILPYNDRFNSEWAANKKIEFSMDGKDYSFTPQEFTDLIESWYRALRKQEGLKPEEARQWLPIGLKSQIVQTYNLKEWRHWFYRRADRAAHPEIRFAAVNLLTEVHKRIPGIFDDFKIHTDLEVPYAVYVGNDPLI